uniref:Uncharacterized protein n=1 Tax=Branchiostoma floridae TaxID=7739 RepID=C3Y2B4_BRAFL|eukprot:XP_002609994.1 hypothetical protein BRAFLDRAFT_131108 [Branchiostoma floridae]
MASNNCKIWVCVFFFVVAICSFITLITFGPLYGIDSVAELQYRRTQCTVKDSSTSEESCTYNWRCTQNDPHGGRTCQTRESTLLCLNVTVEYTIPNSSGSFRGSPVGLDLRCSIRQQVYPQHGLSWF